MIYYYILAVYYYASFFRLRILRKEEVHSGYRIWYLEIVFSDFRYKLLKRAPASTGAQDLSFTIF